MDLNKVFLIGNLTRDPESRFLQSGQQVTKLGLAVNRRYTTRDGEKREDTLFIDVDAWGKTAELCGQYLRKGSQIMVEGRLKMDKFTTQSGENRTKILVTADHVSFGARPNDGGQGGGSRNENWGRQTSGGQQQQSRPEYAEASAPSGNDDGGEFYPNNEGTEDDLPF